LPELVKTEVTEYVGSTMYVKNDCVQVMSDCWENQDVAYSITETGGISTHWVGDTTKCVVDATEEAFDRLYKRVFQQEFNVLMDQEVTKLENPAKVGCVVEVVRGRKDYGVEGTVVAVISAEYRAGWRSNLENKVAIALDDEVIQIKDRHGNVRSRHVNVAWVWARNCKVVYLEDQIAAIDQGSLIELAKERAQRMVDNHKRLMEHHAK
jgi:hypothetical protein